MARIYRWVRSVENYFFSKWRSGDFGRILLLEKVVTVIHPVQVAWLVRQHKAEQFIPNFSGSEGSGLS